MTGCCPNCGYDLKHDELIELDGFRIDPREGIAYEGASLRLPPSARIIISTLAKESPRNVSASALIERIGGDAGNPEMTLYSQVRRLRRKLGEAGIPSPVATVPWSGYRWDMAR